MDPQKDLQRAKQEAVENLLLRDMPGNVVGVGIGKKSGEDCLRIYVADDCLRIYVVNKLERNKVIPKELVPEEFLGVPTDVIKIGRLGRKGHTPKAPKIKAPKDFTPQPGSPIRVETDAPNVNSGATGTLGAVVEAGAGERYVLSCNHILAVNGRVLEDRNAKIVSAEFVGEEPPIADPAFYVRLRRHGDNLVDCALAQIKDPQRVRANFPEGIGKLNSPSAISPQLGRTVMKVGAATGPTEGTIVDINADLYTDYSFGRFRFINQVVIERGKDDEFATEGDSGSIVWDKEKRQPLAMVFAASGRFAVACPLPQVLDGLQTEIRRDLNDRHVTLKLVTS